MSNFRKRKNVRKRKEKKTRREDGEDGGPYTRIYTYARESPSNKDPLVIFLGLFESDVPILFSV